jgi:hypothetical protein
LLGQSFNPISLLQKNSKMNFLFDISQPKVDNIWAYFLGVFSLICNILSIVYSKKIESKYVFMLFGMGVLGMFVGAYVYTSTYKDIAAELKEQKEECEKISKQREEHLIDSKRDHALKDTCVKEGEILKKQLESANQKIQSLGIENRDYKQENNSLSKELDKYQNDPYDYYCGYAAIREGKKTGKWGYLKKGYPRTTVEFIYDEACRFSEGRAFVKYKSNKYGIIDTHLGIPLVDCIFEKPQWFEKGKAIVIYKGERIFIDKKGDKISSVINNTFASN